VEEPALDDGAVPDQPPVVHREGVQTPERVLAVRVVEGAAERLVAPGPGSPWPPEIIRSGR
jgi:hypothetical protein